MALIGHLARGRASLLPRILAGAATLFAVLLCSPVSGAQTKSTPAAKKPSASAPAKKSTTKAKPTPKKRAPVRRTRARGQAVPTKERIREIQAALARNGHFAGEPTGKWDASTTEAMRKFQERHGLRVTGKLDAQSLQRLGLGSPVAGLAPPLRASGAASSN